MSSQTQLALADATVNDFAPFIGSAFTLAINEGEEPSLTLELTQAAPAGPNDRPFSLMFSGPSEIPANQGMYWIGNEKLGTLPLFIVPVRADAERRYYEAIFN